MTAVPPRYAAEVAPVRARFTALVILDGSRLAAIAHRLKLPWNERAVVLPGCLLGHAVILAAMSVSVYPLPPKRSPASPSSPAPLVPG